MARERAALRRLPRICAPARSGRGMLKIGYGASLPKMVDAVKDPRDRAALLARDLLGDYGNVSHAGQEISRKLIPFWSWMEINAKRYWRLSSNAFAAGHDAGRRHGRPARRRRCGPHDGLARVRMFLMFGLMQLWNHWLFPDEEDELGEEQRRQLHLILGRTEDGRSRPSACRARSAMRCRGSGWRRRRRAARITSSAAGPGTTSCSRRPRRPSTSSARRCRRSSRCRSRRSAARSCSRTCSRPASSATSGATSSRPSAWRTSTTC
jgi:hypothetical protein